MATAAQQKELQAKITQLAADRFGGDFQKVFEHYSNKKDRQMHRAELMELLKDANVGAWLTRGAWADGILAELDTDKDGAITQADLGGITSQL